MRPPSLSPPLHATGEHLRDCASEQGRQEEAGARAVQAGAQHPRAPQEDPRGRELTLWG